MANQPTNPPSEAEVKKQIAFLETNKSRIPHFTAFGDDNWEGVEAQIEVLTDYMSEEDVEERSHHEDEDKERKEDDSLWPEHSRDMARHAAQWLAGETEEKPGDGWNLKPAEKKTVAPSKKKK